MEGYEGEIIIMKKKLVFFSLIFMIYHFFAHDISFYVDKNTRYFIPDDELSIFEDKYTELKSGQTIKVYISPLFHYTYFEQSNKIVVYCNYTDGTRIIGYLPICNLIPVETKALLNKAIISVNEIGFKKKYIPAYMLKVLYKKNRDLLIENDTRYKKYHKINPEIWKNKFEEALLLALQSQYYYAAISNIGIRLHSNDNFIFKHITEISKTEYECKGIGIAEWNPYQENMNYWQTYFENTSETAEKEEILRLIVDGDYLTVFNKTRNKEIIGLVLISDTIEEQLINLFKDASCDLSRVTWPRHADGSCDYETAVTVQQGKCYRASDNLRLRSSGSTAGKPVVTIGKGTQVKVLGIGAEQTIDGITSNWVQVEVQAGAKDRDGKPIAAGTVGWCFGGYLGE